MGMCCNTTLIISFLYATEYLLAVSDYVILKINTSHRISSVITFIDSTVKLESHGTQEKFRLSEVEIHDLQNSNR